MTTTTMKAAVLTGLREPWKLIDIPIPHPGPHQVLIKVKASGLCYTDVHITEGILEGPLPRILGHEVTGEVVELGSSVSFLQIGDRVGVPWLQSSCGICEYCISGRRLHCPQKIGTGNHAQGGHAEFMLAFEDATVPIPACLPFVDAAPLLCAGYTAWSGIRAADPQPKERLVILGAGGVGHLAIQFAKMLDLETIVITHSSDKVTRLLALGADTVLTEAAALAGLGGADIILATSSSYKALNESLATMRPDGRAILMGISNDELRLSSGFLLKRHRIIGSQHNDRQHLLQALEFAGRGRVKPIVEQYPLGKILDAYDRVASGLVRFRAVIVNE